MTLREFVVDTYNNNTIGQYKEFVEVSARMQQNEQFIQAINYPFITIHYSDSFDLDEIIRFVIRSDHRFFRKIKKKWEYYSTIPLESSFGFSTQEEAEELIDEVKLQYPKLKKQIRVEPTFYRVFKLKEPQVLTLGWSDEENKIYQIENDEATLIDLSDIKNLLSGKFWYRDGAEPYYPFKGSLRICYGVSEDVIVNRQSPITYLPPYVRVDEPVNVSIEKELLGNSKWSIHIPTLVLIGDTVHQVLQIVIEDNNIDSCVNSYAIIFKMTEHKTDDCISVFGVPNESVDENPIQKIVVDRSIVQDEPQPVKKPRKPRKKKTDIEEN